MYQVVLAYQSLFAFKISVMGSSGICSSGIWYLYFADQILFYFSFELLEKIIMKYLRQSKGCQG